MQVTVIGAREVEAKLQALPNQLRRGIWDATPRAAEMEARTISSLTPQLTGALAGSVQIEVSKTADGARARIYSDVRYAPFVEHGTAKHGAGQHMFERGSQQASGRAVDLYRVAMDEIAAAFG
jgi:hypothetical protein